MKIRLLFFFLCTLTFLSVGNAQNDIPQNAVRMQPTPHPGGVTDTENHAQNVADARTSQIEIGTTTFDIPSYGCTGHRLHTDAADGIYAAWHFSEEFGSSGDRGTAVAVYDGTEWGAQERIEGELRGGFPSYAVNEAGDQFATSHVNVDIFKMGFHSKSADENAWTTTIIPSETSMVWGKIAVGGDNGEVIHAVGLTLAADFGGADYEGMVQQPLYFRSSDKGATWDITDLALPMIDSTKYLTMDAEAYTIEARGDVVAVGFFPAWGDAVLVKSTDGGENFSHSIIIDHPIDKYDDSFAYTPEDTGADLDDPNLPDSLAILSTDSHASMLIDENDVVHVTVGKMYYSANGGGDRFFFPLTDGMFHWTDADANTLNDVTFAEDFNADDVLDYAEDVAVFQRSITGMPSMGMDDAGTLYVAYSALHELYVDENDNQNFHQIFIVKSEDGGSTWTEPFAVINGQTFDENFVAFVEGVFPQIPAKIDDSVKMIYEQDFRAGLSSWGDEDPPAGTSIVYVDLNKEDFGIISSTEVVVSELNAAVTPTLTAGEVVLEYFPTMREEVSYEVLNAAGGVILQNRAGEIDGYFRQKIDLHNAQAGLYFLKLQTESGARIFKIVKQ